MDINSLNRSTPTFNPIEQAASQCDAAQRPSISPIRGSMDRTSSPLPPCAATQDALVIPRVAAGHATARPSMSPDTERDISIIGAAANMVEEGLFSNLDCSGPQAVGARLKQVCSEALGTLNENKPEAELWRQLERASKAIQTAMESIYGSQYDLITEEKTDEVAAERHALLYAMHQSAPELLREIMAHDLATLRA